jgi:mannose-1-phosphate guanylyltransferase
MFEHLYAVILAGGSGTRFWPASRAERAKQYLAIGTERPLLVETARRLEGLVPPERVLVVTTRAQAGQVRAFLPELPGENVIAEPLARNTAPCLALAARELRARDPDSVQIVLPADHVIRPAESFRRTMRAAALFAQAQGALVVCGIKPTHPATGFGYVEAGPLVARSDDLPVHSVQRFVEKPALERAREFLASGRFLWNAGIFVWRTDAIWTQFERHLPEVARALAAATTEQAISSAYAAFPAVAVDVAILERATGVHMLPIDYFWSDVGSWPALAEVCAGDAGGNVTSGGAESIAIDASGNVVHAEPGEIVALIGVSDLVVVHSRGATLVCPKDQAQRVKELVERLQRQGGRWV